MNNQQHNRKSFASFLIVFAALAVLLVLFGGRRQSNHPALQVPAASVSADAENFRLNTDQLANFESFLHDAGNRMSQVPVRQLRPLDNEAVIYKLAAAKKLVEQQAQLPHAWEWERVQAAVRRFGESIPFERAPAASTMTMAYDSLAERLMIGRDPVNVESVEGLAALMVHEATHVVVTERALDLTGYTRTEMAAVIYLCYDFSINWKIATEALSFRNQAAWHATRPGARSLEELQFGEVLTQAMRAEAGDTRDYAASMLRYAQNEKAGQDRLMGVAATPRSCGAPPMLKGADRGLPFTPVALDTPFLGPIVLVLLDDQDRKQGR